MDKAFWTAITENEYKLPEGYSVDDLTPELLGFLGSPDITVRDPFGYMILLYWIVEYQYYSPDSLREMRDDLLTNLKTGLGQTDTDTIFLRSFSILVLSLIVYYDLKSPFLSESEVKNLIDHALDYLRDEKDLRGFIPEKGWAHSTAHTADILKFLSRNPLSNADEHHAILNGIAEKLLQLTGSHIYMHGEDERLSAALMDILKRGLMTTEDWSNWIDQFTEWKNSLNETDFNPVSHAIRTNSKNLLRSFFLQIELAESMPEHSQTVQEKLLQAIKTMGLY